MLQGVCITCLDCQYHCQFRTTQTTKLTFAFVPVPLGKYRVKVPKELKRLKCSKSALLFLKKIYRKLFYLVFWGWGGGVRNWRLQYPQDWIRWAPGCQRPMCVILLEKHDQRTSCAWVNAIIEASKFLKNSVVEASNLISTKPNY